MALRYAVLGAGRQGTAAAYDMAKFGDAELVKVADADLVAADVAILMAKGVTPRGAKPVETAVPGPLFASEMRKRGLPLEERFTFI